MKRFNIALLPSDAGVRKMLSDLAQSYFAEEQDGYLLGDTALAHVTLCQFFARNECEAVDVFNEIYDKSSTELLITKFQLRIGEGAHLGKLWVEFLIDPVAVLLERQRKCFQQIVQSGLEPLTPAETYWPHITLARLSNEPARIPSIAAIPQHRLEFHPVVGVSTENGVLVNSLSIKL